MNWEAIGAVAELTGAVGVIASLVYLATQIRQNTRSLRATAYRDMVDMLVSSTEFVSSDKGLTRVLMKGLGDLDSLEGAEEHYQFSAILGRTVRNLDIARNMHDEGLLDASYYQSTLRATIDLLSGPGAAQWWQQNQRGFPDVVRQQLNAELPTQEPAEPEQTVN